MIQPQQQHTPRIKTLLIIQQPHKIEDTETPGWAAGAGLEVPSVVRLQRKGMAATETRPPDSVFMKEMERRLALELYTEGKSNGERKQRRLELA
jgi:hypothetical protein